MMFPCSLASKFVFDETNDCFAVVMKLACLFFSVEDDFDGVNVVVFGEGGDSRPVDDGSSGGVAVDGGVACVVAGFFPFPFPFSFSFSLASTSPFRLR